MRLKDLRTKLNGANSRIEALEETLRTCWLAADAARTTCTDSETVIFLKAIAEEIERTFAEGALK